MHDKCFPASQSTRLDDPARQEFLPTAEVLALLGVHAGEKIADVGAGTGYFSLPLAEAVGAHGKVYAVDAQAEMLARIRGKMDAGALDCIELIHAEGGATCLPASSCDLFFAANVWHEFDDRAEVLREAQRVLKPEGRIAILDWRTDVEPEAGPPLAHRIAATGAQAELAAAGFHRAMIAFAGRYSWLVKAEKQP